MARTLLLSLGLLAAFGGARGDDQDLVMMVGTVAPALPGIGTPAPAPPAVAVPSVPPSLPESIVGTPVPTTVGTPAPAMAAADASTTAAPGEASSPPSFRAAAAEFVAMTMFVIIGCGSAMGIAKEPGSAWVLEVALVFGIAITCLAYSLGCYSGGQINCAVTLTLAVVGKLSWLQALCNFAGQMLGSVFGALVLLIIFPRDLDRTGGLGSNAVGEGFTQVNALIGEVFMTFMLCLVVLDSGFVEEYQKGITVIVIGFTVFLAHCVLIPIDGCSINPTRSFGPALVSAMCVKQTGNVVSSDEENEVSEDISTKKPASPFKDMWVFWVGPIMGSLCAAAVYLLFDL